ncbi:MAG: DUF370 domain-containing protein [Thermoleophilaceae bacterium]|nr:DUF370 domain-containing protein [Thermoleophilaceae bacterium]
MNTRLFLSVGRDFWVGEDDIAIVQGFPTRPGERLRQLAISEGRHYDATRGARILSLVLLRNGWVVASPHLPETLITRARVAAPVKDAKKP